MAHFMKLSLITQTDENIIVTVNNGDTFTDFQSKLIKEHRLLVSLDDFKCFDENLNFEDDFFQCLINNLNDQELLNLDSPVYQINLSSSQNIKSEQVSTYNITENQDNSFIVLNSSEQDITNILQENMFDNLEENAINKDSNFEPLLNEKHVANSEETLNNSSVNSKSSSAYNYVDIVSKLREIHDYSEESVTEYCRLCANIVNNKIMIFNSIETIDEQINTSLPIKISTEDGLPQQICEQCFIKLQNNFNFMTSVMEADKILKLKFGITENSNHLDISNESNELLKEFLSTPSKTNNKPLKMEENSIDEEYLDVEAIEDVSNSETHHCRICDLIIDNLKDALLHSAEDHKIDNLYACIFCQYGFETTILLSQHIQTEHKNFNKYICKVCKTHFAYQVMLQKHICLGNQNKKYRNVKIEYSCDICKKLFSSKTSLSFHKKIHSNKCEICGKIFADKQTLKEHAVLHMDTKPFQCHVCGKHLNRLSRLKTHMLTHESTDLIVNDVHCCLDCKEAFENEDKAILHRNFEKHSIAVSKLDKVFRCEFCERCYVTPETLKQHRNVHNALNLYICHICSAQFTSYSRLTSHKTSHGLFKIIFPVIKYFVCNLCDKSYLHWTHLTSHKKLKHSNNEFNVYKCIDCNLEFPTNWGIAYHRKTKHTEEPIKCIECGENVANYEAWKKHRLALHANKKYNYQCVKCNKIFQTQETLEDHLKTHRNLTENKCPYCPSSFVDIKDLGTHLKIHRIKKISTKFKQTYEQKSDARPYNCKDCGLTFRKQFTLKNHKHKYCTKGDRSKFILMVDMNEDDKETNQQTSENIVEVIEQNILPKEEQFIDLGNGNFVQFAPGNTVNIDGKEYFLMHENEENMIDQPVLDQFLQQNDYHNVTINDEMDMETDNTYIINNDINEADNLIKTFVHEGTTYILGDQVINNNQSF